MLYCLVLYWLAQPLSHYPATSACGQATPQAYRQVKACVFLVQAAVFGGDAWPSSPSLDELLCIHAYAFCHAQISRILRHDEYADELQVRCYADASPCVHWPAVKTSVTVNDHHFQGDGSLTPVHPGFGSPTCPCWLQEVEDITHRLSSLPAGSCWDALQHVRGRGLSLAVQMMLLEVLATAHTISSCSRGTKDLGLMTKLLSVHDLKLVIQADNSDAVLPDNQQPVHGKQNRHKHHRKNHRKRKHGWLSDDEHDRASQQVMQLLHGEQELAKGGLLSLSSHILDQTVLSLISHVLAPPK